MKKFDEYKNFIEILKVVVPIYKENLDKKYYKVILSMTIRMVENLSNIQYSVEADKKAKRMGLKKKLSQYKWHEQTNKNMMNDLGRKIFHWEHYYPVEQIIKELCAFEKLKEDDIFKIISKTKIVWILKEENKRLDKIAKSIRPNPEIAYKEAGIKIVEN
jgi:hypothetical protein